MQVTKSWADENITHRFRRLGTNFERASLGALPELRALFARDEEIAQDVRRR